MLEDDIAACSSVDGCFNNLLASVSISSIRAALSFVVVVVVVAKEVECGRQPMIDDNNIIIERLA